MGIFDSALNIATGGLLGGEGPLSGGKEAGTIAATPFNIQSSTGLAGSFEGGDVRSSLSPELQALFDQQLSQAGGFLQGVPGAGAQATGVSEGLFGTAGVTQAGVPGAGQDATALSQQLLSGAGGAFGQIPQAGGANILAGQGLVSEATAFDPFAAAEEQFGRLDAILEPGRTKSRTGAAGGLLATGRLGSTSGNALQAAIEGEIEAQRQGLLGEQFTAAQGVQQGIFDRGTTLQQLGLGEQAQAGELANLQLQGGLGVGAFGADIQGQQQSIASQQLSDALASGAFGLESQGAQQALGQQSLQGALGIDAQLQAALGLGSQISAPVGTTAPEKSFIENAATGFFSNIKI